MVQRLGGTISLKIIEDAVVEVKESTKRVEKNTDRIASELELQRLRHANELELQRLRYTTELKIQGLRFDLSEVDRQRERLSRDFERLYPHGWQSCKGFGDWLKFMNKRNTLLERTKALDAKRTSVQRKIDQLIHSLDPTAPQSTRTPTHKESDRGSWGLGCFVVAVLTGVIWLLGRGREGPQYSPTTEPSSTSKSPYRVTTEPSSTNKSQSASENISKESDLTTSKSPSSSNDMTIFNARYDSIQNGMTYSEVCRILGSNGDEVSTSKVGDVTLMTWRWTITDESRIYVRFQHDKVLSKSQFGLR